MNFWHDVQQLRFTIMCAYCVCKGQRPKFSIDNSLVLCTVQATKWVAPCIRYCLTQ